MSKKHRIPREREEKIAEDGFDPSTSGLWAQHASAAPLCCTNTRIAVTLLYVAENAHNWKAKRTGALGSEVLSNPNCARRCRNDMRSCTV